MFPHRNTPQSVVFLGSPDGAKKKSASLQVVFAKSYPRPHYLMLANEARALLAAFHALV